MTCIFMTIFGGGNSFRKMPLSVVIVYMTIGSKALPGAGFQESGNT